MPLRTTADDPPAMNLIPMIDIMFNVIIFLVVGTDLATSEHKINLRVPEVVGQEGLTPEPEPQIVNVYQDGKITLAVYHDGVPAEDRVESLPELINRLKALGDPKTGNPALRVLLRGDENAFYGNVAKVLNACKQAGIQKLAVSVRLIPPEKH
jgi:biopolymer transport protein ExbD